MFMKECDQHKVFHVVNTSCASCPLLHFSDIDGPQLFISELCLCVCVCVCVCVSVCVCVLLETEPRTSCAKHIFYRQAAPPAPL
jgi:hypothetical protein